MHTAREAHSPAGGLLLGGGGGAGGAEEGRLAAALSVALDRLGSVRDALGAVDGEVRRLVAERVRDCAPRAGVAWVAPDEFVVSVPSGSTGDADALAAALIAALDRPFPLAGQAVRLGAAIGVAHHPDHGATAEAVRHAAGVAMRRARHDGGGRVRRYDPAMTEEARRRLRLAGELHGALERGELEVHYQPQVDLWRSMVVGAEALVRWRHPRLGLLGPDAFLPLADDDGSIVDIDRWVIGQACEQARRWLDARTGVETVAVNVSPRTLTGTDVVTTVAAALAGAGLPAARFEVEVSERLVAGRAEAERALAGLQVLGVRLAIDDFGTGHSSLAHLQRLPVSTVKLDRGFVAGIGARHRREDVAVIRAVVAMARDLRMRCVAEGVETPVQSRVLGSLRCHVVQGHLFGAAAPPAAWAPGPWARLAAV